MAPEEGTATAVDSKFSRYLDSRLPATACLLTERVVTEFVRVRYGAHLTLCQGQKSAVLLGGGGFRTRHEEFLLDFPDLRLSSQLPNLL